MTTTSDDMVERVARAIREADFIWGARRWPHLPIEKIRELVEDASDDNGYEDMARAAIEAYEAVVHERVTLEMHEAAKIAMAKRPRKYAAAIRSQS